jgi:hypothetical protein
MKRELLAISANCRIFNGGITGGKIPASMAPRTGTPLDFKSSEELIAIAKKNVNSEIGDSEILRITKMRDSGI